MHPHSAAAIFVHPGAHAVRRRGDISDLPIGRAAHQHIAAAFARAPLDPVDVAAIDADVAEPERLPDDQLRGDRRAPGAIRQGFAICHADQTSCTRPCDPADLTIASKAATTSTISRGLIGYGARPATASAKASRLTRTESAGANECRSGSLPLLRRTSSVRPSASA